VPDFGGQYGWGARGGGFVGGDGLYVRAELRGGGEEGAGVAEVEGVQDTATVGGEVVLGGWEGVRAGDGGRHAAIRVCV